jgi:hypothetical protein
LVGSTLRRTNDGSCRRPSMVQVRDGS